MSPSPHPATITITPRAPPQRKECDSHRNVFTDLDRLLAQSAGAVEYTDCFSAEG